MAKQTGTFVDEGRLVPRDNSPGPLSKGGDFGGGGKTVGGEPSRSGGMDTDEFKAPARKGRY